MEYSGQAASGKPLLSDDRLPNPRAVLFDVYGTLLAPGDLMAVNMATGKEFFELLGMPMEERPAALPAFRESQTRAATEFRSRSFYLHRDWVATSWYYAAENLNRPISRADAEGLSARYWRRMFEAAALRDGATETLAELRARGGSTSEQ